MIEVRNFLIEDKEIQTRSEVTTDGKKQIIGMASLTEHRSKPITEMISINGAPAKLETYIETIKRGAFDGALMQDVIYNIDHDPSKLIARKSAGNLSLSVTDKGLMFSAILPNTTLANDLAENIAVGNYQENSFAFRVKKDSWERDKEGNLYRNISSIERVVDVSTVVEGAYSDTIVATRSLNTSDFIVFDQETIISIDEENEIEKDSIDFEFQRLKAFAF